MGSPEGSTERWSRTRPAQGTCRVEARRIKTVLPLCSPAQAPGDSAKNNSKGNGAVGRVPAGRTQVERGQKSGQRVAGTGWFPVAAITCYHRLGGVKHGFYSLTALEARSLKSKLPHGLGPSGGSEGEAVPGRPSGFRWPPAMASLACRHLTQMYAPGFPWPSPVFLLRVCPLRALLPGSRAQPAKPGQTPTETVH